MEFNFDIAPYFKLAITKVGHQLIPENFVGDRREVQECVNRMNLIMTVLGENSAKAQGLQKVITSGDRLRNSDHVVYIYSEPTEGLKGNGVVIGMLKIGTKRLYLFDASGENHEVFAKCVLDFYVHESRQRSGLGKKLFEHMLQAENILPQHLAIDKPSEKFSAFLKRHYNLQKTIPQMNNFVLFEGFFDNRAEEEKLISKSVMAAGISSSAFRNLSGGLGTYSESERPRSASTSQIAVTPTSNASLNVFGRPPMHRPISTMGQILRQESPQFQRPSEEPTEQENENSVENLTTNELADEIDAIEAEIEVIDINPEPEIVEEATNEVEENLENNIIEPEPEAMPCKVQAATPHLDLKFYHSSLW